MDSLIFGTSDKGILALTIFALVLALIIIRRVRNLEFPIWSAMMIGAALMILLGVIDVSDAYNAIDFDVIFFLIGMFSIVAGVEKSGLLGYVMYRILSPFKNLLSLLIVFVFLMGFLSALTVNDTMAVVGTIIVITIVKQMLLPLDVMLMTLAFSITVGSVMTPIGNPQNMLIASQSGMIAPFFSFVRVLGIPTLINLAIVAGFLWFTLKRSGKLLDGKSIVVVEEEHITDLGLARTSGACLVLAVGGFILNDLLGSLGSSSRRAPRDYSVPGVGSPLHPRWGQAGSVATGGLEQHRLLPDHVYGYGGSLAVWCRGHLHQPHTCPESDG